ncbi:MAG: hypothetical protein Alis3KO_25580 [Aliiglaciecola sp.]
MSSGLISLKSLWLKGLISLNLLTSLWWRKLAKAIKKKQARVKLVAIAKDEAAYLPEWIFHHLKCSFDNISIYINNTTDNTKEIIQCLKTHRNICFFNGDDFFADSQKDPQVTIYKHEICKSRWQGYSHVMFLDIDEFLLSPNAVFDIKKYANSVENEVSVFEWAHCLNEDEPFLPAIRPDLLLKRAKQVKSLIPTHVYFEHLTPHNVYSKSLNYRETNGEQIQFARDNYTKVSATALNSPAKPAFVMHRMTRSEMEYVAALVRGRPIKSSKVDSIFKNNRGGMFGHDNALKYELPQEVVKAYRSELDKFLDNHRLHKPVERAKEKVTERYLRAVDMIRSAPLSENKTLQKVLKNITLESVTSAFQSFKQHHKIN